MRCTLLTRQDTQVLKVDVSYRWQRRCVAEMREDQYSFTVGISGSFFLEFMDTVEYWKSPIIHD